MPAGRLMANVPASVAAFETEVRAERVMAGLAVAKAEGVLLGRPRGVHTRIKVTSEQAAQVRRLKDEGQGVSAISRGTGLSRPTVYSLLGSAGQSDRCRCLNDAVPGAKTLFDRPR